MTDVLQQIVKRCAAVLAALVLLCPAAPFVFAAEAPVGGEAGEITDVSVRFSGADKGAASLLDRNRSTSITLEAGDEFTIEAEGAAFLYLIWDQPPAAGTVSAGGTSLPYGEYGFLHEALPLPDNSDEITIRAGDGSSLLCDVYLFGEGALPAWVQQWQPYCDEADLLALPTHADDEHLFFGGILPTYAGERGLSVQVAYLTNHWGERYRPHELLDGLWTVGVTNYPYISAFPDLYADSLDAALGLYDRDEVMELQVMLLRRFRPKVVVGHDLDGEYGHGVHILNATTLVDALSASGDAGQYPDSAQAYGAWEVPKAYLHLYPENALEMDWDVPLARFDGATAFEMAVEGFAKHTSQQTYFEVEQWGPYDCRKFGLVHSTVGPDAAKDDLFENIDLTAEADPPESDSSSSHLPASDASSSGSLASDISASASAGASSSQGGEEETSSALPTALVVVICLAVVVLILLLVLLASRRKPRRRRRGNRRK